MEATLTRALEKKLGRSITRAESVAGGDINAAYRVALSDGALVFVKSNPRAPKGMFVAEARGLDWLREAEALPIPRVLATSDDDEEPGFLVLEYIEPGPRARDFDDKLGRGLAALHRHGAPAFGLAHDNFIGALPQQNDPFPSWASFYRERRLRPQLERAASRGHVDLSLRQAFDRLFDQLGALVGPEEPPSRLHGDLWGGNLHVDTAGEPCLIDPAVYGGHREIDLAMMRLFGGFSRRVFQSYGEDFPLAAGAEDRVPLYQLYPLLVHVNHFGSSYVSQLRRALTATLAPV